MKLIYDQTHDEIAALPLIFLCEGSVHNFNLIFKFPLKRFYYLVTTKLPFFLKLFCKMRVLQMFHFLVTLHQFNTCDMASAFAL